MSGADQVQGQSKKNDERDHDNVTDRDLHLQPHPLPEEVEQVPSR
jgi:hypothetical protein